MQPIQRRLLVWLVVTALGLLAVAACGFSGGEKEPRAIEERISTEPAAPISYSFLYPNRAGGYANWGSQEYLFRDEDPYGPFPWWSLTPQDIERVDRIGYATATLAIYSLTSAQPVVMLEGAEPLPAPQQLTCFGGKVPGPLKDPVVDSYSCFVQDGTQVLLTESDDLEEAQDLLLVSLDGSEPEEVRRYLPSLPVLAALDAQLDLNACHADHRAHFYTRSCAGEGRGEQCHDLDMEVRTIRLRCRAETVDLRDLELVVTIADDAARMEHLFEEAYAQEVQGIELRHLDNVNLAREGDQILWSYPGASIQFFVRKGATVLAMTLPLWQYEDQAHDAAFFQELLDQMTALGQEIDFPDVSSSEAIMSSGGRGLFTGLQEFQ